MSDLHRAIDEQRATWPERPTRHEPESIVAHDRDERWTLDCLDGGYPDPDVPTRAECEADERALS